MTGVNSANTTISHSVESIHVFDGLIIYSISGSVSSSANETIEYYPDIDRGYSYDGFRINVSDLDDDGIEDILDNCQSEPNPGTIGLRIQMGLETSAIQTLTEMI